MTMENFTLVCAQAGMGTDQEHPRCRGADAKANLKASFQH